MNPPELALAGVDEICHCRYSRFDIFLGDNVQWRIDLDHTTVGAAREIEWGFALSTLEDSTQQAFVWSGSQKSMEHIVVRDDETGTTRYEGALALPVSLEGETAIGLSVLVNENDPLGREGMLDGPQGYSLTPRIGTDSAI